MRRTDRQISDRAGLTAILQSCDVCRLGLVDGDQPYVVPLNFGYTWQGELPVLYLHCALKGYKLDLIAKNSKVCIEMDCGHELEAGNKACDYSYYFASLIGQGRAVLLEDEAEKLLGLQCIMERVAGPGPYQFPASLKGVAVLRVELESLTGKHHPKP